MSVVRISPDQPNNITVTQNSSNTISVTEEISKVVVVSSPGPKGDKGDQGINATPPVAGLGLSGIEQSGEYNISLDTGSAHFTNALAAINNAGIFKQTGSFWATTYNLQITGSLTIGGGLLKLNEYLSEPTPETGAIFYSASNFYVGLD